MFEVRSVLEARAKGRPGEVRRLLLRLRERGAAGGAGDVERVLSEIFEGETMLYSIALIVVSMLVLCLYCCLVVGSRDDEINGRG